MILEILLLPLDDVDLRIVFFIKYMNSGDIQISITKKLFLFIFYSHSKIIFH